MRRTRLWGLLWMSFFLELQDVAKSEEDTYERTEGQTLSVICPFHTTEYSNSRKAWQRLRDGEEPETLIKTESTSGENSQVRSGRYFLEDIPVEGMLVVQMTDLRQEDSGLYQCVIYQPPKKPYRLFSLVRLVVRKDGASASNSTQNLPEITTLSPITTKARGKLRISPSTVTQLLPISTVSLSSPGLGVNPPQSTDVIRISPISIIAIVVCGILIKSLVFTVLLVVTQRSFGP
ncbi:triggering receptor expressed on myeloid cells 1 [Pteronotus mesoamericanus]|uniref:triggering receptor expressed on myeloid cells 1 n=1 Tax=Pteronotus mesoamericanus TaxID=1884717 RepID=UPI0023EE259C|nr:triggering receptor expressed on myeloid cells 1 [Pteronotus parnellii mesoamericanus]